MAESTKAKDCKIFLKFDGVVMNYFSVIFWQEEDKLRNHPRFNSMVSKYFWNLFSKDKGCSAFQGQERSELMDVRISKSEYEEFMKRVYRALLPNYKEREMPEEINQEWHYDCREQSSMSFDLFSHLLFRLAHAWTIHVDLEEYLNFLENLYSRITVKAVILSGYRDQLLPKITISFPEEEDKIEKEDKDENEDKVKDSGAEEWEEVASDSSNKSDFEYKYEEDETQIAIKKYKRPKQNKGQALLISQIKEPIFYKESLSYDLSKVDPEATIIDELIEEEYVLPLGFPSEQAIMQMKNSVYEKMEAYISQKESQKSDNPFSKDDSNDPEDTKTTGKGLNIEVHLHGSFHKEYEVELQITDYLNKKLRSAFKDCTQLTLRCFEDYNPVSNRENLPLSDIDPLTEVSSVGFNPALDRRVEMELNTNLKSYINANYIVDDKKIMDALRCKMPDDVLLPAGEKMRREEDFSPPITCYKDTKRIMLCKKFENLYQERLTRKETDSEKMKLMMDKIEELKDIQKYDRFERSIPISKARFGQFHQLISKEGLKKDSLISDNQIITRANELPLSILIIGKPRSGKSNTAKHLAERLDLVHITVGRYIVDLEERIKSYEPPEDLEDDQEPPKWLSDFEEEVHSQMIEGKDFTNIQIVKILCDQVKSNIAQTKGYILDLPYFSRNESWSETLKNGELGVEAQHISYIIELDALDDDIKERAKGIRLDLETGEVVSVWEREQRKIKKKKPQGEGEGEDEDAEESEEELDEDGNPIPKPKIFNELEVVMRPCDSEEQINEELIMYDTIEKLGFQDLLSDLHNHQYIRLDSFGLTPEQITEAIFSRVTLGNELLRPLAVALEGEGDFKALLTQGLEEPPFINDEEEEIEVTPIPRNWSLWQQTDPVHLAEGKVILGQPDFAASYHHQVFVFESEETQLKFIDNPKMYLQKAPEMPKCFRLLISGQAGAGKKTIAEKLANKYGWIIADFKKICAQRIEEMKVEYVEAHKPNNPVDEERKIGLGEAEWTKLQDGQPLEAHQLLPWFYQHLGLALEKRRPKPKEEGEGEEEEQEEEPPQLTPAELKKKKLEEERKKKAEALKKKNKKQEESDEAEEEEEEEEIEDIPTAELDLLWDEEKQCKAFCGGFILLGFPETAEQMEKFKEEGLDLDKILHLKNTDEEDEAGDIFIQRNKDNEKYDHEAEQTSADAKLALYSEQFEDKVIEVSCNGTIEEVFDRVQMDLDPFFIRLDNPDNVKTQDDVGEEGPELPWGEYGNFCPITLTNESWLYPGESEFQVSVKERSYKLAGETEKEEFEASPMNYIWEGIQRPPHPHIMFVGQQGSGVHTQLYRVAGQYKLTTMEIKERFLVKLNEAKTIRKRDRLLARGFKEPEEQDADDEEEPQPDPEIEDDPDDFEKGLHEQEVFKSIFDPTIGQLYNGNWFDMPDEEQEIFVDSEYQNLIFDSRRPPEVVIYMKVSLEQCLERLMDKDALKASYDKQMEELKATIAKDREEARNEKIAELKEEEDMDDEKMNEALAEWDKERDEADAEKLEGDDVPNLETMTEEETTKLTERHQAQGEQLDELINQMKEKGVQFFLINGNFSQERVFKTILKRLKPFIQDRRSLYERFQIQEIIPRDVVRYEKCDTYSLSRFGRNSPTNIYHPEKSRDHVLIYRQKLYYFRTEEEKVQFMNAPFQCESNQADTYGKIECAPQDLSFKPTCLLIGPPSSGKTEMCEMLSSNYGMIHLQIHEIIEYFLQMDSKLGEEVRDLMGSGCPIESRLIVELIARRVQMADCVLNGWVLQDFPKTKDEAVLMNQRGLIPMKIFCVDQELEASYKLTEERKGTDYKFDRRVFRERILRFQDKIPDVISYYHQVFSNVRFVKNISKWYVKDFFEVNIQESIKAMMIYSRRQLDPENAQALNGLIFDQNYIKQGANKKFGYYCPVTWKNDKKILKCHLRLQHTVSYKEEFYYFADQKSRDLFISYPDRYLQDYSFPIKKLPKSIKIHKAAELFMRDKMLKGYCPVTLVEHNKNVDKAKSYSLFMTEYNDQLWTFASYENLLKFQKDPERYCSAQLPVKMPPQKEKVYLGELSNSISYLEQSVGKVVTRAMLEVGANRVKYPGLSIKETSLKLFAILLKADNPSNTAFMKDKYQERIREFLERCKLPSVIYKLNKKREKAKKWTSFEEKEFHQIGEKYDKLMLVIKQEIESNSMKFIR